MTRRGGQMKMKIGFDNDKYLAEQSAEIRRRAQKYDKSSAAS